MKKILLINALLLVFLTSALDINAQCATTAPSISGPIKVCAGTIVNYNSLSFGVGNFIWSINGGGTFLGPTFNPTNPQVNWTQAGNWQISISTSGCPSTPLGKWDVEVINSATIPAPTSITGPAGVCNGSTSVYSVPAVAGQTPIWLIRQNFGFPNIPVPILVPSGNQVSINWSIPIQTSYTLFASYTNGICSGMQASLIINHSTGTAPITLNGNGTDQFCLNQFFNFTAYGDPQDTFTWSISPPGGSTITPSGNSALVQWTSAGIFSVNVSATNPCGAPRNTSKPVTVGPSPTLAPGAISKQNAITCLNQTERLSVPPVSGATSYKWTIGLPAGNYYYTTSVPYLDQTFSSNASATATVIASNGYCDSPPSPIFSFNIGVAPLQLSLPPSVCVGTEITLTITSTGSMTGYVFAWNVGDGVINGPTDGSSIRVKWNSSGQRFVFAAANTPCGAISAPAPPSFPSPINVQDPSFTMNPITGVSMACLGQYQYYAPVTQIGITPTWALTLQGGGATSGGTISNTQYSASSVTWNTPGNYTLTANATNSCGTSQSQSINITVASGPKPTTGLINAGGTLTRTELVCTASIPVTRNYSVPLTAGYNYAWEAPLGIVSSTANNASITWNQSGTDRLVKVTPSTANCIGEMEYLYSSVYLNSAVGTLSSSISTTCTNFSTVPITLSLTSSTGNVTYQVRKKADNGIWTAWSNIASANYTETFSGTPSPTQVYYLEFQALVQNSTCSPITSNVVPVSLFVIPWITNNNSSLVQEICSGQNTSIVPISSISGSTFSWTSTVTGTITGASSSGVGNISDVLINTGTTAGRVDYFVTPKMNGCNGIVATFTRYIYPRPVVLANQLKSGCSSPYAVSYDVLVSPAGVELNWPDPDGSGPATGALNKRDYGADITDILTNNGSTPLTITYQITPFYRISGPLGCSGATENVVVTVNPKPSMTSPATTAGCSGLPLNLSLTSNVPSSFSWWATNNFYTTGESLAQKNTSIINDVISLDQGTPQNVTYSVYPTSTIGSCIGTTQTVTASIGVNQTITFNTLPAKNYGDPAFTVTATASSGLPVSFSSSNPAVATISGNTVTIVGGGATNITASQAGNATYCSPPGVVQTLTVNKANQTITFSPLPPKTPSDPAFTLTATASSGLPVTYTSSIPTVATISSNTVTLVGTGTTTITASQAGNANYNPATDVQQSQVVKINQTITFAALPAKTYGDPAFSLTATASSGLPVSYVSSNTSVATITGNTVTIVGGGSATITASQAGDANYYAAPGLPQTLTVNRLNQTITFSSIPSKCVGVSQTLSAASSSGLAVIYASSNTSVATISGTTLIAANPGTVTITASQPGNSFYNAAPDIIQSFTVNPAPSGTISPSGATTFCQGGSVTLTSSPGSSYAWSSGSTSQSIVVSASGNYRVTVTNASGCSATSAITTVTVNSLPTVTVSPSSATICVGSSTTLTASGLANYSWSPSAGLSSTTGATVTASPTTFTIYTVSGTTSSGCPGSKTVSVATTSSASISVSPSSNICTTGYAILTANPAGGTYSWSDGSTSRAITVNYKGIYSVVVRLGTCNLSASKSITKSGINCGNQRIRSDGSDLTTPPNDFVDVKVKGSSFYPNPVDKELTAQLEEPAKVRTPIRLMDQLGKSLIDTHFEVGESKKRIDTEHLMEGLYLLIISDKRDFPYKQKVLIVHKP